MKRMTSLFAVLAMAAIVAAVPAANAQVNVHYIGGGSSAMFQGMGIAAFNDLATANVVNVLPCNGQGTLGANGVTCTAGHWTIGSTLGSSQAHDAASGAPDEPGNTWIVWVTCTATGATACPRTVGANNTMDVWAYLQLDSAVGVREFLRRDSSGNPAVLLLNANGSGLPSGANKISASFFTGGVGDSAAPPADAVSALSGTAFTAGMTDIRMEDALQATLRVLGTCPSTGCNTTAYPSGAVANPCPSSDVGVPAVYPPCTGYDYYQAFTLGYGNTSWTTPSGPYAGGNQVGSQIQSSVSGGALVTPVGFSLPGFADPFSGKTVPSTVKTFPVGESPVIVVANRSNANGLGQIIGNIPSCKGTGAGDAAYCVDDLANGGPTAGGPAGAGYSSDGSYLVRNLWDQHPFPPQFTDAGDDRFPDLVYTPRITGDGFCASGGAGYGTGWCKESRRPLGALFASFLCETAAYAFSWPLDSALQGNRVYFPTNGSGAPYDAPVVSTPVPITIFEREPTSGTYNTFEYTEVRRFGGNEGNFNYDNNGGRWIYTAYLSQEDFVDGSNGGANANNGTNNPMALTCQTAASDPGTEGIKKRSTGTGELIGQVKATTDSIGYAFFSFGNVSSISKSTSYGYLMIDGIDPIFQDYANNAGEPGQPAAPATPKSWGELPSCSGSGCKANAIWLTTTAANATTQCPTGTVCTYPNLRNGTYPAWSELRMMCDTAVASCSTDTLGAEALIQNLQWDIHNSNTGGVPDFLPFSDSAGAGSVCTTCSFNPPYGDVSYIRDHSALIVAPAPIPGDTSPANPGITTGNNYQNFILADDYQDLMHNVWPYLGSASPQTIHKTINAETQTQLMTLCGSGRGVNSPPQSECGGDVGGWVIPVTAPAASNGQQQ